MIDRVEVYEALLAGSVLAEAACITFTDVASEDVVIRAFGGDPATAQGIGGTAARDWETEEVVLVGSLGGAVIAIEPNGFQGCRSEVVRPISVGGRAR